ncbi:MAG: thiol-disulfide isomerase, partial [Nitrososphaera sp.]
ELYFGYDFARAQLGNPEGFRPGQVVTYSIPENTAIKPNIIYLSGDWKNNPDSMELQSDVGKVVLTYTAKAVNIVAGDRGELQISEDSSQLTGGDRGSDVSENGQVSVDGQRLYNLAMHDSYGTHQIEITVTGKGFDIYTFTFG